MNAILPFFAEPSDPDTGGTPTAAPTTAATTRTPNLRNAMATPHAVKANLHPSHCCVYAVTSFPRRGEAAPCTWRSEQPWPVGSYRAGCGMWSSRRLCSRLPCACRPRLVRPAAFPISTQAANTRVSGGVADAPDDLRADRHSLISFSAALMDSVRTPATSRRRELARFVDPAGASCTTRTSARIAVSESAATRR